MGCCSSKLGVAAPLPEVVGAVAGSCTGQQRPVLLGAVAECQTRPTYTKKEVGLAPQLADTCDVEGFEAFLDKDAFAGSNAEVMSSADLCAVKQYCADKGYGGFAVWNDTAYFRPESAGACLANLVETSGVTFYINNNQSSTSDIKAVTYNLFWWNLYGIQGGLDGSASKIIAAANPDMLGCQECEDILRVLSEGGLSEAYAAVSGPLALAMAYKVDVWESLGDGSEIVAEDQAGLYGSRGVQWMRLRRRSDERVVFFMNHHGPLPVNTGGATGGTATAENILNVISLNAEPDDAIILLGDFNAQASSETVMRLAETYPLVYSGVSFGGVDHFFSTLAVVSTENLGSGGSDHDALAVTFAT